MFEYELDGEVLQFTQEDVDNRAKEKGLTTEEYLTQHPEVKPVDVEKTNDVATQGAPVASEESMASNSEDTFLDIRESDLSLTANKHDWLVTKITDAEDPSKLIEVPGSKKQFFNLKDDEAAAQLSEKYPGFEFKVTSNFPVGKFVKNEEGELKWQRAEKQAQGFNVVKITAPNGEEQLIEFNLGMLGLVGAKAAGYDSIDDAYEMAYNDLTSFIDKHSTLDTDKLYIEGVIKRRKLAQDLKDRTKYSDQDKALIEEKYSVEDLFDMEETDVSYRLGSIQGGTPITTIKKNQPYLEELKQAREELIREEGVASKEAIEERAREILVRNELSGLWQNNISNFMEELDDSGLEYYAQEYALAIKEFDREYQAKILLRNNLQFELEKGESANRLAATQEKFDNPDYQFTDVEMQPGETLLTLENGKQVPESVFNQYQKDFKEFGTTLNDWKALTKDIVSNADQISEVSNQLDLLKRNYNAWEEFTVKVGLGLAEMGVGSVYGMGRFYGQTDDFSDKAYIDFKNQIQAVKESYKKDIEFDNAFTSIENFGRFTFQETITQLPVIAALLTPGGLSTIGFQSFGDQYSDMVRQDMMPGPQGETTQLEKWWASLGYGAAEVVFGSLPSLALARNFQKSILNTATKNNMFKSGGSKYVNDNLLPTKDLVTNMVLEPIGEGMTQVTQNIISGRPLMEGVDHAMFTGGMFSTSMGSVPFVKGMYLRQFSDFDKKEQIRLLRTEQKDLANFNERLKKGENTKVGRYGKRKKLIAENDARIEELQTLIELEVAAVESKVKTLGNRAAEFFNTNYIRQEDIRLEAQEIEQDASIPDNIKQKKLADLKLEFDNIQNTLDQFRKSETFNNNWVLFQGNKKNKSEVDRINDLAKQQLESEGIKDANAEQINERSRIIYNTEVINADIAKARKSRTKFSNAMKDFQTTEEAIAFLQEDAQNKKDNIDPNLSEELRAKEIAAIEENLADRIESLKEGGHGMSITDQYNQRVAIVVVDNMAKDDRLETRTHEMKHVLFAEAVGTDSWRFADMADQILMWTEKNANDSYLRIISQAARYKDGRLMEDEVIAVFFEEVAGKKINLNKKTGFAGVLGHLLGKGVKDAFDIEIDLAGETDAVKFLTGIAVKIKENTLTVKDVKSVLDSEVLKKNKKLNDKIIADIFKANEENTSKFSKSVSQKDVFTNSNDALVENLKLMGIENPELFALSDAELQSLRTEDPDVFKKMVNDWNNLGDKRWMGVTIGPMWRSWVEYNHLSKRDKAFNYDLFKDEILDVTTVGIEPGDNGIPFIINTWKPGEGRSLTSHIYGEIGRRLMGTDGIIDRKFPLLDKALVALDAESDVTGKSSDLAGGEDVETTLRREKEKTKDREIAESKSFRKDLDITDEQAAEIELEIIDVLASENIKSISDFDFTNDFEKRAENKLFKVVKNMMGTRDKYVEFLNSKQATLIENIHTRDFAQMEKREENKIFLELVGENVGPEKIKKALNDGSLRSFEYKSDTQGPNIYQKKKVEPKEFVDFFQVRGRKDALAKNIVHSLGMDAVFPIVNTVDARIEAAIENGDVELTKKLREVKRKYQGGVSHIKQRIDRNSDLTKFSKLYADFSVFEKKIFGSKLQDFGKAWNKHLDVDRAFEEVYGEDFLLRETETGRKSYKFRNAFLKDIKRYLSIYQQYEAIKASQGDFVEQNLESFLRDEVTSKDDVSEQDLRMIFGLEAGSIDFSNPNQLISARSALLKVMRKMGKTKSIRFIKSAVTGPTQIGGTDLIASSLTDLKPGLTQRRLDALLAKKDKTDKDLAKIEKYKKRIAEGANPDQRYGLTDSAKDFNDNFLSELKDDNLDIPKRNTQNAKGNRSSIDQDYSSLEANAKADADFLIELMDVLAELEGNNDITANDAAMIIQTLSSGMDTPLASAAIPRYVPETKVDGPVRWEHMIPRRVVAMYLANYQRGVVSKNDIKKLFDNFFIAVIPETSDKAITAAGFQAKMHATWGLDNIDPMPRYLNMGTFGAWDVVLYDLKNKKIVEKSKNFADANKLLLEDKFSRSSKQNISKAISNTRPVLKYSETSRGMSTFDFDDTLAFTKSGIRLTRPNDTGKPQPGRKAILLVGAAGAGKTTVINQLGLRNQGFKYVNQDVALDWLSKNSGLPQNMNDFTREQSNKWMNLQYEAASAAKNKAAKLRGKGDGVIIDSTGGNTRAISRDFKDAGYDVQVIYVNSSLDNALARNKSRTERRLTDTTVRNSYEKVQKNLKEIKELVNFFPFSVKEFVEVNTDNIKQGDALPTEFVGKVNDFTTGYIKERINAEEFAAKGADLLAEGAEFDFSEFNKVVDGTPGPLLQKMKNQIEKYGSENVYVLTARPAASAGPIHQFLKDQGINIPLENITGLGNSTGDAKAAWMLDKYAEGYNDMYFVDDAMQNVEAVQHVFNQLDIKGKSVQAKTKFSKSMSLEFNKMIERTKGVGAEKTFSRIGAQKRGKNVGRFGFFVPPSADDFAGLLRYFVGKGEQGNKDLEFFNKALIKPFARADRDMKEARQAITDDYKALRKEFPKVAKKLGKMIDDSGFTFDNAIRVYLWDKAGFEIPGLSKRDIAFLTNKVKTDQDLKTYADVLGLISKLDEGYIKPSEYWDVESITSDLQNIVNKEGRKKYLAEWIENKNELFSPENLNKIEATYGSNFREALENILWRMENGTNRAKGMGRLEAAWNNWVNNSVGAIMFFNARSAVLQTLSTVNFINFEDNNIFAAAKAFGNQKQYWKDFSFLFNSDFLKQRRAGLQTNINEAELASAIAGATNKAKAALQYLLKIGFTPTQIADSFAIAAGGSTYYRNRIKKYVKEGMDQKAAEQQAMLDFQEIAEETQQSARPDRISQQQASSLGRIILAFANTPMQYNRLIKKAAGDLVNGRGDWRSNISRIVYYGAIQNIIFSSLQAAIFALAFDDEEPEEDEIDKKRLRLLNGMADSLLRGSGLAGAVVSTLKNTVMRFLAESEKDYRADYGNVLVEALNVSPPIGSKARKLYNATKTYKYNKEVMGEMSTFDLENPVWDAVGNVVSATTNLPLDRGFRKIDNMKEALNQDNETWQRIFVGLGWDQWSLGIDSRKEVDEARKQIKEKKKEEKKKNQQRCTKIKSDGFRCKIMVDKPKKRCHYHD